MLEWLRGALRPSRKQVLLAVVMCLLGMSLVLQMRNDGHGNQYSGMRRDDLVQLLDTLNAETEQLNREVSELEATRDQLESGADANQVAAHEAQARADELAILAGTRGASGPGVRITISAPSATVSADLLLDAVQELRDAGAEVIEINDSVRLVAQSWITDEDGLVIDGQKVQLPIVIDAIGDPHSLAEGARFRGGLVSQVESSKVGGSVEIQTPDSIEVTSIHSLHAPEHARPA